VHPHRRSADTNPVRLNLARAEAPAQLELRPIGHRLATALLVGDTGTLLHAAGWPFPGTRERLRASAVSGTPAGWMIVVDGVVVGDCAEPARAAPERRRPQLTVAG
jgi:hypothetical protein